MLTAAHVCGVSRSILGQPWRWRGTASDGFDDGFQPDDLVDPLLMARGGAREGRPRPPGAGSGAGFQPDDLVDQLLMARGVIREELLRHREPTIRGFMPDPSIFRDLDLAAPRPPPPPPARAGPAGGGGGAA